MITVTEALEKIAEHITPLDQKEEKELKNAIDCTLAEDVFSNINMPPFRQSAMDGYAIHLNGKNNYQVIGEVKAGDSYHPILKAGESVRIFTGAPVPDSANAVIMQEKVSRSDSTISIEELPKINANIRPLGEQVLKGNNALKKGTRLTPAAIGFLSSIGITKVLLYKKPSIAIVATGNELVEPGKGLSYGQIYESNTIMLENALQSLSYKDVSVYKVTDDYESTYSLLENLIATKDLILISGGISVGDYDFVGKALEALQVEQVFYKVKQKPGKPLFYGKKEDTNIFALPGNPAAALSCFYIYVYNALEKISGNKNFNLLRSKAKPTNSYTKKGNRAQFLKASYNNGTVTILEGQSSAMLHTFAVSNALVYLSEDQYEVTTNDNVDVIHLPNTNYYGI